MKTGPKIQPLADRFWKKVKKTSTCWLWTGLKTELGYGRIYNPGGSQKAHRVAYQLVNGKFDDELEVCHRCDNPSCVNPDHLFLGAHKINMSDMVIKGRSSKGEHRPLSKLTNEEVLIIKQFPKHKGSVKELSTRFKVSKSLITYVRKYGWKHIYFP